MNSLKAEEDEKSAFSGRKSRKERRILKEKRLAGRIPSPPSYATYDQGYVICLLGSLSFVKDKHTVGGKMARNCRKMGICYCHSFILRL